MKYNPDIVCAFFESEGLPSPVFEYSHIPGRKFRIDVCWIQFRVGVEVQGGIFMRGRKGHASIGKMKSDMEKNNLGLINSWRILTVIPQDLMTVKTAEMIRALINVR